jgi:shikimate dehydrogenase
VHDRIGDAGLVINTTSAGLSADDPLPIDVARLAGECIVSDIVYVPLETPLLAAARARGLAVVDGLGMLLYQAVQGFEIWFGVRPEVTDELRALVVADLTGPAC